MILILESSCLPFLLFMTFSSLSLKEIFFYFRVSQWSYFYFIMFFRTSSRVLSSSSWAFKVTISQSYFSWNCSLSQSYHSNWITFIIYPSSSFRALLSSSWSTFISTSSFTSSFINWGISSSSSITRYGHI